jgi:hypothetical protein
VASVRWASPPVQWYVRKLGGKDKYLKRDFRAIPCAEHMVSKQYCGTCREWDRFHRAVIEKFEGWTERKAKRRNAIGSREEPQSVDTPYRETLLTLRSEREERVNARAEGKKYGGTAGYVYIIENPAFSGWIKIGSSENPRNRLSTYQTADPLRAYRYVTRRLVLDRLAIERRAQALVASHAEEVNGEWFKIDSATATKLFRRAVRNH